MMRLTDFLGHKVIDIGMPNKENELVITFDNDYAITIVGEDIKLSKIKIKDTPKEKLVVKDEDQKKSEKRDRQKSRLEK